MPAEAPALGILLISGGHERAHYALVLATAAAAVGRGVVLFATNQGVHLFHRDAKLLADANERALRDAGVATLATLLEAAAELPVRRIACEAGLRSAGVAAAELAPGTEVAGVVTFLQAVGGGQIMTL